MAQNAIANQVHGQHQHGHIWPKQSSNAMSPEVNFPNYPTAAKMSKSETNTATTEANSVATWV